MAWDLLIWVGPAIVGWVGMVLGPVPDDDAMSSDEGMIAAVRAGDATAYRGLVERYQGRVYALLYGMVRNPEDARDLTQDAFVKAYRNLHTFREDARFYTWIYRIAMNLAIDFVRRRGKGPVAGFEEDVAVRDPDGGVSAAHHGDSPGRALERKRLHAAILAALDRLPEDQKQVVLLRELEGLSYKEIASILDIAEGTVMSRLFYARKKLQAMLVDFQPAG
jgi:RNA polymerase sigma-70 factor (ECF subfamily)